MTQGLTSHEANARRALAGPNALPAPPTTPAAIQFLRQLVHFFALMLWVAAVLALLAGLPQLSVAIVIVIVANGTFAFVQEYRAEHAVRELGALLPRLVTVVRDGLHRRVDAIDLVVGDVVLLDPGDRVPADLRVLVAHAVSVNTSALTGESVPESLDAGDPAFAGTFLTEGECEAEVIAIGADTRLAGIAHLTRESRRPPSPLAHELTRVVRTISWIAVSIGLVFFALMIILDRSFADGAVIAIGVTVALVPEGLLPTVTLSLALGGQRMAHRDALVRHLEAVETLGSTTFVCTDKTGTLTLNEMEVVEAWTPAGSASIQGEGYGPDATITAVPSVRAALPILAGSARAASTGHADFRDGEWVAFGDPMEAAIDAFARRVGVPGPPPPATKRFPFDPRRRRMSVVLGDRVVVKGAPDSVLARCATIETEVHDALDAMTRKGFRVLAVAERALDGPTPPSADDAETHLALLGLLAFEDPPRPGARDALEACRRAGIKVAMVTGDHPRTAHAIAVETGLALEDAPVVIGAELPTDDDALAELVDCDGIVLARVDPEDKLRVARALRARGHVVGMTGDGVNDGPALQQADIGIAMGERGTDVAREAADLVLLDDNFATIVAAIEQGRATFVNIRKFLTYHLSDNVAELTPFAVWAISGGRFPLALGILQVLALDVVTDTFAAVALGADPPAPHELERPPIRGRLLNRLVAWRAFGVLGPTEALMSMAAFVLALVGFGWSPGDPFPDTSTIAAATGATFIAVVFGQGANAFACRSATRSPLAMKLRTNPLLVGAVGIDVVIALALVLVPALADLLDQGVPSLLGWIAAMCAVPALLTTDAIDKLLRRRRMSHEG